MKASLKELWAARLLRWYGSLLTRTGHSTFASQIYRAADNLAPADSPEFAYAHALWKSQQYEESKSLVERILNGTPEHPEANNLLGILLFEEDRLEQAEKFFERAILSKPDFAAPHNNLGNVHLARDEITKAAACYQMALKCDSGYVEALTNLGGVLNLQGQYELAETYCRKSIELSPEFAGAHCNLGNVLLNFGRGGEAVAAYRESLRLQPGLPEALVNLALVLENNIYLVGTIDYYEKLLKRQPNNHMPHVRVAQAMQALQNWDEARGRLMKALELKPEAPDALFVLGVNYVHVGDVRAGMDCLRRVLNSGPHSMAHMGNAFNSLYLNEFTGEQLCVQSKEWAERYLIQSSSRPLLKTAGIERRLRIGYVSRDFARHSVAYFLEPIVMHHSRNNVEIFCYSTLLGEDDFTDRFRKLAHNWRDISTLSQEKVVALIKNDGIDILVDLSGYTVGARLGVFSCKPAPIQITYLGHPTTTGLRTIDFRLGDEITDPTELTSSHYVERLWHMPGCFLTYQPPADAPSISPLPMLTNGYVTFGSFNNAAKINDDVIHAWASILSALPESRLLLKGHAFVSQHGRDRVSKELIRRGITQDRFELIEWRANIQNHLELYREIDIALDTFPYNGTTTTCEALWMGVPVVTLCGQRHSCRVGASLLTCLRMTELISESVSDYIACATALASDSERLEQIHNTLRDRMASSPLLDHVGFTRNLENIYRAMWKEWCAAAGYSNTEDKNHNGGLRLHIGGEDHKDGWTVLNITPGPNVDIVGDLKDLSNLRSGIVTEIYASHVLEHVDQQNIPVVLEELWRILQKPGGKLMISVPDMEVLCRMFLRKDLGVQGKLHVMRMIFGGQVDAHDYHQVGLYFEHLRDLLKSAGFHDIQRVESFGLFEDTSEYAPYGERISLNVIAIA